MIPCHERVLRQPVHVLDGLRNLLVNRFRKKEEWNDGRNRQGSNYLILTRTIIENPSKTTLSQDEWIILCIVTGSNYEVGLTSGDNLVKWKKDYMFYFLVHTVSCGSEHLVRNDPHNRLKYSYLQQRRLRLINDLCLKNDIKICQQIKIIWVFFKIKFITKMFPWISNRLKVYKDRETIL